MDTIEPTLIRDNMEYWLLPPDGRLRPFIRCYFVVDAGQSPYRKTELLLPDGYSEIVFTLDAGFERWGVGEEVPRSLMKRSYLIGGRSHSVLTGGSHRLKLIGVKLDPRVMRHIAAMPLGELRDSTLELRDLNNKALLLLEDQVSSARSVGAVASALDSFFLGQLTTYSRQDALVDHVLHRIHSERGMGQISSLAHGLQVDSRTLERRFLSCIGMTPKKYARIVRFKHSYHRLITEPRQEKSAAHPHLDGYYDQSHFNKDFKYFTGVAPSTLMEERAPSSTAVTDHLLRGDLSSAWLSKSARPFPLA